MFPAAALSPTCFCCFEGFGYSWFFSLLFGVVVCGVCVCLFVYLGFCFCFVFSFPCPYFEPKSFRQMLKNFWWNYSVYLKGFLFPSQGIPGIPGNQGAKGQKVLLAVQNLVKTCTIYTHSKLRLREEFS